MNNLVKDLSKLTTINEDALNKLAKKALWVIADDFYEDMLVANNCCEIDISIGKLVITNDENSIKYKFIPTKELEDAILTVATESVNPLQDTFEKNLVNKITNTYKDLF